MTRQELFDTAVRGVLTQGHPSVFLSDAGNFLGCLYRQFDKDGRVVAKCAIGHAIPDEFYETELDDAIGGQMKPLVEHLAERGFWLGTEKDKADNNDLCFFLVRLQSCHDAAAHNTARNAATEGKVYGPVDNDRFLRLFRENVAEFAKTYSLSTAVLEAA